MKDRERARRSAIRLGAMWGVLLVFVAIALVAQSLVVLAVGVVASMLVSVVMRLVGR
ncbi:MAG TPA: hypothetical protein VMB53_04305 [Gaiellaceae bacterium]|nr:hypothetical protein [Gaiellaceae bacterium]